MSLPQPDHADAAWFSVQERKSPPQAILLPPAQHLLQNLSVKSIKFTLQPRNTVSEYAEIFHNSMLLLPVKRDLKERLHGLVPQVQFSSQFLYIRLQKDIKKILTFPIHKNVFSNK